MTKRLTEAEWRIIARALCDAMEDRAGYADAYGSGPEADKALAQVAEYEALHRKIFDRPSGRSDQLTALDAMPTVSIFDLHKSEP